MDVVKKIIRKGEYFDCLYPVTRVEGRTSSLMMGDTHEGSGDLGTLSVLPKASYNASHVRPLGRPDRKYDAGHDEKPLLADNYVKIAARPKGQYHAFVEHSRPEAAGLPVRHFKVTPTQLSACIFHIECHHRSC